MEQGQKHAEQQQGHSENKQRGAHHREVCLGREGVHGQTGGDSQGHHGSDHHQFRVRNRAHERNLFYY